MDQKTWTLWHWALESDKDFFFPSKVKKTGYHSTVWNGAHFGTLFSVGISYENIIEKWSFVALPNLFYNHPSVLL